MASNSNVIREFLVACGFRIDQPALTNFVSGIKKATQAAITLGAAVTAMATTVAIGIQKFASNLEQLYFASIRTGSSATNLMAFDRAMQNFGASAGEGVAMVEQLAHILRTSPGSASYLESFIGPLKHLKDGTVDAENALERLGKSASFRAQPDFIKFQIGSQFGLSDTQIMRLLNGDFSKELSRVRAEVERLNLEKATKDAHDFMVVWRDFTIILQQFGIQVYEALGKKLGFSLEKFRDWMEKNGPWLAQRVADILTAFIQFVDWVGPKIEWLIGKFVEWDKETDGWSTKIIAAIALLKIFGGFEIISAVLGLAGAFGTLSASAGGALTVLGGIAVAVSTILDVYKVITGKGPGGAGTWIVDNTPGLGEWLDRVGAKVGFQRDKDRFADENPLQFILDQANGRLTRAQAAGLLANFKAESNLNPNARNGSHYGLGQWDPSRQADFATWAGHDIHGTSAAEQMLFSMHELFDDKGGFRNVGKLLQGMNNARAASYLLYKEYEKPKASTEDATRRGDYAAQYEQNVTIHIYDSKDPRATAKQVESSLDRLHAQLARNTSPAMR